MGLIANLRPETRHDIFLKAAAFLSVRHSDLRFFIIGDGPGRLGVEALIRDFSLDSSTVRLLGARDDTPELLRALDIACLCSDIECLPVVMLEAAAAGCAFIGPTVGCIPEFLTHRETGLLVQPSDTAGLADAISELSLDAELRRRLTVAAGRQVRERYDADSMAGAFAELLNQSVATRRAGIRSRAGLRSRESRPISSGI